MFKYSKIIFTLVVIITGLNLSSCKSRLEFKGVKKVESEKSKATSKQGIEEEKPPLPTPPVTSDGQLPLLGNLAAKTFTQGSLIKTFSFINSGASVASCTAKPNLPKGLTLEAKDGTCWIKGTPTLLSGLATYQVSGMASELKKSTASIDISVVEIPQTQGSNFLFIEPPSGAGQNGHPIISINTGKPFGIVKIYSDAVCSHANLKGLGVTDQDGKNAEIELHYLVDGSYQLYSIEFDNMGVKSECKYVGEYNLSDVDYGVEQIYSNDSAFAALRSNGSVVTWGNSSNGGDSSSVALRLDGTTNIVSIFSTSRAFAALDENGAVVTWGGASDGGSQGKSVKFLKQGVPNIFPLKNAFCALLPTRGVTCWGGSNPSASELTLGL